MPSATVSALMTGVSAVGSIASGNAKAGEANSEAAQLNQNANAAMGAAERNAIVTNQNTALTLSKAQANAAASGALASSPTAINDMAAIQKQGTYAALTDLYNGETTANADQYQAQMTKYQGQQAQLAGYFDAAKTIAGSGTAKTLFEKYGNSGPSGVGSSGNIQMTGPDTTLYGYG